MFWFLFWFLSEASHDILQIKVISRVGGNIKGLSVHLLFALATKGLGRLAPFFMLASIFHETPYADRIRIVPTVKALFDLFEPGHASHGVVSFPFLQLLVLGVPVSIQHDSTITLLPSV